MGNDWAMFVLDYRRIIHMSKGSFHASSYTLSPADEPASFINADVDGPDRVSEMFHEARARVVEVIIGDVMLAREVAWPPSLVLILRRSNPPLTFHPASSLPGLVVVWLREEG